ncbi:MAG: hypothetical protein Q9169_006297 [Polycauliona sp. 2 TL-2023]
MFAFLLVPKYLLLWTAGLFGSYTYLIDDGPAMTLVAGAKWGYQLTLDHTKSQAYSAPARTRSADDAPLFLIPSPWVSGAAAAVCQVAAVDPLFSDFNTTEHSQNSSSAGCRFAPTKIHDSAKFLPVHDTTLNVISSTALVMHRQASQKSSVPTSLAVRMQPLQHQRSMGRAPSPYDPSKAVKALAGELLAEREIEIVVIVTVLFLALAYVFWANHTVKSQKAAEFECEFRTSFADALTSNSNTLDQLNGLISLRTKIILGVAASKRPIPPFVNSLLADTIDSLSKRQSKIASGEIIPLEVKLSGEIHSLNIEVAKLTANDEGAIDEYEELHKKCEDGLEENDSLRGANAGLQDANGTLSGTLNATKESMNQRITDFQSQAKDLADEAEEATAKSNELEGKCKTLSSENNNLREANKDLEERHIGINNTLNSTKAGMYQQNTDLQSENRDLTHQLDRAQARSKKLESQCDTVVSENNTHVSEDKNLRKAKEDLEGQNLSLNKAFDSSKAEINSLKSKVHELEQMKAKNSDLRRKYDALTAKHSKFVQNNPGLESQNRALTARLEASETKCSDLVREVDNCQLQIQQSSNTANGLRSSMSKVAEELDDIKKDRDALEETAKQHQTKAECSEELVESAMTEKDKVVMELKAMKVDYDALAKKVQERSTSSPASSQCASGMNDTNDLVFTHPANANNISASFDASSIQPLLLKIQRLQQQLTHQTQDSEQKKAVLNGKIAEMHQKMSVLNPTPHTLGPSQPSLMNVSNAYHHHQRPGGPGPYVPFPAHPGSSPDSHGFIPGQPGMPQFQPSGGFQGFTGAPDPYYNRDQMDPTLAPTGLLENTCLQSDGQSNGMNAGCAPWPQSHSTTQFPSRDTHDYEHPPKSRPSYDPKAPSFTPGSRA